MPRPSRRSQRSGPAYRPIEGSHSSSSGAVGTAARKTCAMLMAGTTTTCRTLLGCLRKCTAADGAGVSPELGAAGEAGAGEGAECAR